MIGRAAGHLPPLLVPGFHDVGVGRIQHPIFGPRQKLIRRHHLVDQLRRLGLFGLQHLAFQQHRRGGHRPHHARIARRAAAAGEKAHQYLRQPDPAPGCVGHEPTVASKRDLGPDSSAKTRNRAGHRLAALVSLGIQPRALQFPHDPVPVHHEVKKRRCRIVAGCVADRGENIQVHAAREGVLTTCNDNALDPLVGQGAVDKFIHQRECLARQHVHRLARHIPCNDGHAVVVKLISEVGHRI